MQNKKTHEEKSNNEYLNSFAEAEDTHLSNFQFGERHTQKSERFARQLPGFALSHALTVIDRDEDLVVSVAKEMINKTIPSM
jgi:hypothetical protein